MAMRGTGRCDDPGSGDSGNDLLAAQQFQQIGNGENPGQLAGVDTDFESLLNLDKHFHHPQGIDMEIINKSRIVVDQFRICSCDGLQKTS